MTQASAVEYTVINPNSGPNTTKDDAYEIITDQCHAKGISVLGYVSTEYGARPPTTVLDEIRRYEQWYGVSGIFFDEAASGTDRLDYYAQLYKSTKGTVVLNPGVYPHQAYAECCDILCVEERGIEVTENRSVTTAEWMRGQPPEKFWYLIFNVADAAKMRRILKKAQQRNVGYIYVTNDALPNPWDGLPIYWKEECAFVEALGTTLSLGGR